MDLDDLELQARNRVRLAILTSAYQHKTDLYRSFEQAYRTAQRRFVAARNDIVRRRHYRNHQGATSK